MSSGMCGEGRRGGGPVSPMLRLDMSGMFMACMQNEGKQAESLSESAKYGFARPTSRSIYKGGTAVARASLCGARAAHEEAE